MYRQATFIQGNEQRRHISGDDVTKRQAVRPASHGMALWAAAGRVSRSGREGEDRDICAFDADLLAMSSSSGTTLQRSSSSMSSMSSVSSSVSSSSSMSSMSSSIEPMGGSGDHTEGSHQAPQLRHAAPGTPKKNTLSNRNASVMKKCHVTGFVNFVEAQPSVGRFEVDDQEPPLHLTGSPAARIKLTDVLVPTIAPKCNYGVFPTHDDDLRHG